MGSRKKYILAYNIVIVLVVIIIANLLFTGSIFFNVFAQEKVTLLSSDELKDFVNGYGVDGNEWSASYSDPNVLVELEEIKEIECVVIDIQSIKNEDQTQIYYACSDEFESDKYVEGKLKNGRNIFYFSNTGGINRLRVDITSDEQNSFVLNNIEINYKTISTFAYLVFVLCTWFFVLLISYFLSLLIKKKNEIKEYIFREGKYFLILFCAISLIFIVLYGKYIWGDSLYVFTDVGSDTFYGYLPYYENYLQKIRSFDFDLFSLEYGIGTSSLAGASQCLDVPFIFILLLFKETKIYQGLLLVTYIKYLFIALFAMNFFRLKKFQLKTSMAAAIMWAYCGWNILWGQHYWLLSGICYFTFLIYCLEVFLTKNKKYGLAFIIVLGIYCSINLYFGYSICACLGVYLLFSRCIYGYNVPKLFKDILKYLVMVILSLLIFAPFIYIQLELVLESSRVASVSSISLGSFSFKSLIVCLGRFITTDAFGIRNYGGLNNLYEDPILATSMLFIPAIQYWVRNDKYKKMGFYSSVVIVMFFPAINYVFIMTNATRWYYFISFVSVNIIAYMLDAIVKGQEIMKKRNIRISFFFVLVAMLLLLFSHLENIVTVNWISIAMRLTLMVCMVMVLFLMNIKNDAKIVIMILLIIIEIIVGNYKIICERDTLDKHTMEAYISSEQRELVDYIQNVDTTLYRIDVYDRSSMLSDAALNGYYGLNSYCSVNSAKYLKYLDRLDDRDSANGMSKDPNHVDISKNNYCLQTLLGTKYVISSEGAPVGYSFVKNVNNVGLYRNENYVNMGYAYNYVIDIKKYESLSLAEKNLALYECCYIDGNNYTYKKEINEKSKTSNIETHNIGTNILASDYEIKDKIVTGFCDKKQKSIIIELNDTSNYSEGTYDISFDLEVPENGLYAKLVAGNCRNGDLYEAYRYLVGGDKRYNVLIDVSEAIDYIKIIPVYIDEEDECKEKYAFTLSNIVIKKWDDYYQNYYIAAVNELNARTASQVYYRDSMIVADYNNSTNNEQVFCVPVGYSHFWKAQVNGIDQEVFPVNDAFCGVYVEPGDNMIVLAYDGINDYTVYMSMLGIIILTTFSVYAIKRKNGVANI